MIRKLEKEGEIVDIGAKSAILSGLALAGRIDEALGLFDEIEKEDELPHSYAVGALVVSFMVFCNLLFFLQAMDYCLGL